MVYKVLGFGDDRGHDMTYTLILKECTIEDKIEKTTHCSFRFELVNQPTSKKNDKIKLDHVTPRLRGEKNKSSFTQQRT